MKVFVVLEMQGGVPTEVTTYDDAQAARKRGLELAESLEILVKPWDWPDSNGEWHPEVGATRSWQHHWYSDEHDVVVAECEVTS